MGGLLCSGGEVDMKATIDYGGELKVVYVCDKHSYRSTFSECRECANEEAYREEIAEHHMEEAELGII